MKAKLWFICLLLIIASSCKKEDEKASPVILINNPIKGQNLKVDESFLVSGSASDASGIKSIQVKLLDSELNNPYVLINRQYESQQQVDFSFNCIIEDRLLESGDFWIRVRAYNNQSVYTQEFVKVHVNELEKKFEKLLVVTKEYQGDVKVYEQELDAGANRDLLLSAPGEMLFSALSSRYQQFYLGLDFGQQELSAYALEGFENQFKLDVSMPYPVFTHAMIEEPYLYYSTGNGQIKAIDASGLEKFSTPVNLDTFPQKFAFSSQYLLAACKTRAWDRDVLKLHYRESGAFIWRRTIDFDIVDVYPFSDEEFLVFGNEDAQTSIYLYHGGNNSLDLIGEHEGMLEKISNAGKNRYLLQIDDNWYVYDVADDVFILISFFDGNCKLKYEPLNNDIYGYCSMELFRLDLESMELKDVCFFESLIKDVQFWYNK